MLTYDSKKRITAAGVLAHRWFKENSSTKGHQDASAVESKDVIQSL